MDDDTHPIYAGLWGMQLTSGVAIDLGQNVTISPTYVHVMSHPMLALNRPPQSGAHHPAPWIPTASGFAYDVEAQLHIPTSYSRKKVTRYEVAKSVVGLLRLYVHPDIRLAVAAIRPFADLPNVTDINASAPIEVLPRYIDFGLINTAGMEGRVDWVKQHWEKVLDLTESSAAFKLAMDVYLTGQFIQNSAMVMVAVWGALEALFSFEKSELRFRVSSNLAAYMVPRGPARTAQQKRAAKLYDARSAAAHGQPKHGPQELHESYMLLRSVLIRMIEAGEVPTRAELEANLFED